MSQMKFFLCSCLLLVLHFNLTTGRKCIVDNSVGSCIPLSQCGRVLYEIHRLGGLSSSYVQNKLSLLSCDNVMDQQMVCCVPPIKDSINSRQSVNTYRPPTQVEYNTDDKILGDLKANSGNTVKQSNYHGDSKPSDANKGGSNARGGGLPDIQSHPNLRLLPTKCGESGNSGRIIGGSQTLLFEMPWMVQILYETGQKLEPQCDGTLINEWYVLTAAHCVTSSRYELKSVALGEYDTRQDPDCQIISEELVCAPNVKIIDIYEAIAHTGYNWLSLFDDIALIRLSEPADFNLASIKPICLPLTPQLQKQSLVGANAVVAGWGNTERGLQSPVLLSVGVPIVSKEDCQAAHKGNAMISDHQLCAGGVVGKDSCAGDSGGPLMVLGKLGPGKPVYIQRGIVSYGTKECGLSGYPAVYTNVAYYLDWILDHMRS